VDNLIIIFRNATPGNKLSEKTGASHILMMYYIRVNYLVMAKELMELSDSVQTQV